MPTKLMTITDEAAWLEKRKSYVTSTESASLFALQMPSLPTAYELWHIKRGLIDGNVAENARMVWGKRLEHAIAEGIAQDNGFHLMPMNAFAYDDDAKMGSSFDYVIQLSDGTLALLEIKTVSYRDYKEKFIEDSDSDFIEAPAYYEIQVQHELECLDKYDRCLLAVFVMDTRDVKMLWRNRDRDMGAALRKKVREFWDMAEPPPPDMLADSDLLARMQRANSTDKAYDASADGDFEIAFMAYTQETQKEKSAEQAKKIARSRMVMAMGDCNTAWCNSGRVTNKSSFRLTERKEK